MRKVKVAQIGVNRYSHALPIFKAMGRLSDDFEIVGYALVEDEREKFADMIDRCFEGYPELTLDQILNDPEIEAVTVETEEIHLTKYAQMAADHGKKIHMEKPGGREPADFERLIETVKRNQTAFHIGYMYRYNPLIRKLIERVKNGELGRIFSVEAQMNCRHPVEVRQWLSAFPGGMMFYLGCHLVDLVLQLQGKPDRIIPLNRATGADGVTAQDFGMAVFEYPNGVSFVKTCAEEMGGFHRRQLVVSGEKGTVEIRPMETETEPTASVQYTDERDYASEKWADQGEMCRSESYGRYDDMMRAFAAIARGEKENPYSYDYELELYKTLLECCGASKS